MGLGVQRTAYSSTHRCTWKSTAARVAQEGQRRVRGPQVRRFDEADDPRNTTCRLLQRRTKHADSAAEFRVWRHIVENRDAQRPLSAWMTQEATALVERVPESATMSPETCAATIEAVHLRAAIRAQQSWASTAAIDNDNPPTSTKSSWPNSPGRAYIYHLSTAR